MLRISLLTKAFKQEAVLDGCSLEVSKTEILAILGASGSGKTTLLRIIAGLDKPDMGDIFWNENSIRETAAYERNLIYLNQEPLLFPHLSVRENIAFGLRLRRLDKESISGKVDAMLERLGLNNKALKHPDELSGGQKQRVAFGRALIVEPKMLLMDEPFAALDVRTRADMQDFLLETLRESGMISAIFVTHDLKEALRMGDRLALMEAGRLRVFASKADFVRDSATGAGAEVDFWKKTAEDKG